MRSLFASLIAVALAATLQAQETKPSARFGIDADLTVYPQASAKDTLASVLKAIDNKRINYLVAQLSEPAFVDKRVAGHAGKFDAFVQEVSGTAAESAKQLWQFQKEGDWKTNSDTATVTLKALPQRVIYLKKIGDRWYMENRNRPENGNR